MRRSWRFRFVVGSECAHLGVIQALRVRDAINDWLEYHHGEGFVLETDPGTGEPTVD